MLVAIGVRRRRRRRGTDRPDRGTAAPEWSWHRPGTALWAVPATALVAATFAGTVLVSRWPIAVAAALAAALAAFVPRVRPLLAMAAAALLVAARTGRHPGLAWWALALFAVAVVADALGRSGDTGFAAGESSEAEVSASRT